MGKVAKESMTLFVIGLVLVTALAFAFFGCTIVEQPPPPVVTPPAVERYQYDELGYLIVPNEAGLRAVFNPYEFVISKLDFQFLNVRDEVVSEHTLQGEIPPGGDPVEFSIYNEVKGLPPGRYALQVRCWNPGFEEPSDWSEPFKFVKDW